MAKFILTLLISIIALSNVYCYADDTPPLIIPTNPKDSGNGKQHRDIISIPECIYLNGKLSVFSHEDWTFASVYVLHQESGSSYVNSGYLDESITIAIGTASATCTISIITESGNEFAGSFCL